MRVMKVPTKKHCIRVFTALRKLIVADIPRHFIIENTTFKSNIVIIIDGPPASGKSTIIEALVSRWNARSFRYKRLGIANILFDLLMKLAPCLQEDTPKSDRSDPIIIVDSMFLKRMSALIILLEIIYKYINVLSLLILTLTTRIMVVDEGILLGWANYFNLMLRKKAFKPRHVDILMKLDLASLRILSRIRKVYYYFIDRDLEKLQFFWFKRGNRIPYDTGFVVSIKYLFKFFSTVYQRYGIKAEMRYVYMR